MRETTFLQLIFFLDILVYQFEVLTGTSRNYYLDLVRYLVAGTWYASMVMWRYTEKYSFLFFFIII